MCFWPLPHLGPNLWWSVISSVVTGWCCAVRRDRCPLDPPTPTVLLSVMHLLTHLNFVLECNRCNGHLEFRTNRDGRGTCRCASCNTHNHRTVPQSAKYGTRIVTPIQGSYAQGCEHPLRNTQSLTGYHSIWSLCSVFPFRARRGDRSCACRIIKLGLRLSSVHTSPVQ